LLENYPDSRKAEEYKLMSIKSYFQFAELSVEEKKVERYGKVIEECNDFADRFPESGFNKEVEQYSTQSQNNLKRYTNEPAKTTT
jgi:outer membrane protein assembly factor BamD